jgi:hypothetical protein
LKYSPSPQPLPKERAFTFSSSLEKMAAGFAGQPFAKQEMFKGCSFSPGEKVRMRADVKHKVRLNDRPHPALSSEAVSAIKMVGTGDAFYFFRNFHEITGRP